MSSTAAKIQDQLKQCQKLLQTLSSHKDAEPFLEPVLWNEWGLDDYPKVIKTPMDLSTVQKKLENGEYLHPREFKHDMILIWTNCMLYNAEDSELYIAASQLMKSFDEKYSKIVKEDEEVVDNTRFPTLADKRMLSQNIYNIPPDDLGKIVQILDQRCESALKKIDPEDIEIDIDGIDVATFWVIDEFVRENLPGGRKAPKKGKTAGADAKSKKPRTA